jgi:hypothetical protein
MTSELLTPYYEALERLKAGKPQLVPKGTKITNDAVSLEAGGKKGSIKKSRPVFVGLIADIDLAAAAQGSPQKTQAQIADKAKTKVRDLQGELDAALGREQSLLMELFETRIRLNKLTGEGILPLRKKFWSAELRRSRTIRPHRGTSQPLDHFAGRGGAGAEAARH